LANICWTLTHNTEAKYRQQKQNINNTEAKLGKNVRQNGNQKKRWLMNKASDKFIILKNALNQWWNKVTRDNIW